jgi:light-regulated signal transduction histidine kinase (bacteriophytochrome)
MSHDVRAPLRAIDGFAAMVLQDSAGQLTADDVGHLGKIRSATERMSRLLDDLLGLTALTHHEMYRTEVDVSAVTAEVVAELRRENPGPEVTCTVHPNMKAVADPSMLRIIVRNLLDNAWKFTSGRDSAHVEVGESDTLAGRAFFVRDNGVGFESRYANRLFGVFQRLHPAGDYGGEGVGLAIVQRLVSRHGGRVWAVGSPGKGATFYFMLPPASEPGRESSAGQPSAPSS